MLSQYNRARILLTGAAAISFLLFWYVALTFHFPEFTWHQASLLQQSSPAASLLITAVTLLACVLLGTLIAGTIRFDSGLFTAALGLAAFSIRGGSMRDVVIAASSPRDIFLTLTGEVFILYTFLAAAWLLLMLLHRSKLLRPDSTRDGVPDSDNPLSHHFLALITQAFVTAVAMALLAQAPDKAQALASVFIASFLGSITAHYLFPVHPSPWFWTGPLLAAMVGYLLEYNSPTGLQIGHIDQPLARALPLDYASLGTAGAIFGYWSSRRWLRARQAEAQALEA